MKILFVASETATGMRPFATNIINTLARDKRFEVHALVVNREKETYSGIDSHIHCTIVKYPITKWKKLIYKIYPKRVIKAIDQQICTFHPDIVHLLVGDFSLAGYCKKHKNDKRFVYTVHDLVPHPWKNTTISERISNYIINRGYKGCAKNTISLITSSKAQYETLKTMFPHKHIGFTPFPSLVTSAIKNGTDDIPELRQVSSYILFFGNVTAYKGVDILVKAFKMSVVKEKYTLVIAGKGVTNYASDNNVVHINRFIEDREVASIFRNASIVVYPYTSATMSGILSLSYYYDRPTILSDIPFFLENATPGSYYFKNGDIENLKELLNKMTCSNHLVGTRDGYDKIYNRQVMVDAYHKFYTEKIDTISVG